jgi:predicted TIM-barrel fold metal-dependent hydrolase
MRRREWLLASAASLLAGADGEVMMDTHVHFYDPTRPGGVPWPRKEEKVLYRPAMPAHYKALSKARVLIVEASPLFEDNQWILDLAARDPGFIGGCVGHLDPAHAEFAQHIETFRKNRKFLGIRLGSRTAEESFAKLGPLAEAGLSLDLIGGAEMYPLAARLAERYPKLRMILDHLPLAKQDASIRVLRGCPTVYAKVSWILRSADDTLANHLAALDEVWDVFGEDRVVYGSNWPVCDLVVPYGKVQETALEYFRKKPGLRKYLIENSRAAYRWV